ncbi:MAG TPA: DUF1292 domain-containing protein [Clostridia bacterium]|jgi:uncharacterized protein YrzB (UPF0473 family)|nr:DUF1292 domain-containing protein [Clostridia bacterium]HOK81529.1 DUF1292 domain-containing protein [Clostridia bacterium]HOL60975.1 DUF1292 domain-containing protein [Clostridia bacterium]HPO53433.1 DUF1292 domain-containing protein [Clostridia bacterium]
MDENKKKGCCCDHDEHAAEDCCCDYEDDEIVTLVSEDGEEQEFFTLATFDLDGKWYIVLEPAQPIEGFQEGDVIIFRLEEDENGEDIYQPIETEEELEKAFAEFQRMLEEEIE